MIRWVTWICEINWGIFCFFHEWLGKFLGLVMSDLFFLFLFSHEWLGCKFDDYIADLMFKNKSEVRYGGEMCVCVFMFFSFSQEWLGWWVWWLGFDSPESREKYMGLMIRWVAIHRFVQWLGCKFDDDLMACFGFDKFFSQNLCWRN